MSNTEMYEIISISQTGDKEAKQEQKHISHNMVMQLAFESFQGNVAFWVKCRWSGLDISCRPFSFVFLCQEIMPFVLPHTSQIYYHVALYADDFFTLLLNYPTAFSSGQLDKHEF